MVNEFFIDESIVCPGCGGHKFLKSAFDRMGCYVCVNLYDTDKCSKIIACNCPHCQKTYPASDFEFDFVDEYICTHCGQVHVGYSELQQQIEEHYQAEKQLDALRNMLWGKNR